MKAANSRIWELDALRGICILGMVLVHFAINANTLLERNLTFGWPFEALRVGGAVIFIVLSGLCTTLGHHPVRRGLIVFGCGMLFTLVTFTAYYLGLAGRGFLVQFGILHLLGCAMLLVPLLGKLPDRPLGLLALIILALGYWFETLRIGTNWLLPLGLVSHDFVSADWFPLLPHLGWFMLGILFGRTLYASRRSRFPKVNAQCPPLRFLCACGRHSLWIYLLHQPVLYLILQAIA